MARIAGIQITKTLSGSIKSVTIDYKKHKDLVRPLLEKVGAVEEDEFEKEWKKGISIETSRKKVLDYIDTLKWEK
jgi:hypothetical protein